MGRIGMAVVAGLALSAFACGGGEEEQGGGLEKKGSGGSSSTGGTGSVVMACPSCADPTKGCIAATITRTADGSNLPWSLFSTESDGVGTLIASAYGSTGTYAQREIPNADMRPASAQYSVTLNCIPAGTTFFTVFLDDNLDASPTAVQSSDYRDSCAADRMPSVLVAGENATSVNVVLSNSCD